MEWVKDTFTWMLGLKRRPAINAYIKLNKEMKVKAIRWMVDWHMLEDENPDAMEAYWTLDDDQRVDDIKQACDDLIELTDTSFKHCKDAPDVKHCIDIIGGFRS